jgi:hypothetical protein
LLTTINAIKQKAENLKSYLPNLNQTQTLKPYSLKPDSNLDLKTAPLKTNFLFQTQSPICDKDTLLLRGVAQRFALAAVGWAGIMPESRILLGRRKSPKMPQNPRRPLHALLGAFFAKFIS